MMPGNQISLTVQYAQFLPPDNVVPATDMIAYQEGGIALNDPSMGMQVQLWTLQAIPTGGVSDPVDIVISSPSASPQILLSLIGITSVSLAFDQNMQPAVAFTQSGHAKLWWYDATIPGYTTLDFGIDATSPRVTLDDKRLLEIGIGSTSIILGYIRNDNLYMRSQSDRFITENILIGDLSTFVTNPQLCMIQMNKINRLQFFVKGNLYP
jgi:hypothetical protein